MLYKNTNLRRIMDYTPLPLRDCAKTTKVMYSDVNNKEGLFHKNNNVKKDDTWTMMNDMNCN